MPAILTKALAAVGSCPAHPQLSIAFTVKDISAIREEMLRRGYPEEFVRFICAEMNTDFTADKIISYIVDRFEVTVEVSLSPTFYARIFQFGGEIRILSPAKAVAEIMDMANKLIDRETF